MLTFSREAMLQAYRQLNDFARQHQLPGEVSIETLVNLPQVFNVPEFDEEDLQSAESLLFQALTKALDDLFHMRRQEGEALERQLQADLADLVILQEQVEVLAEQLVPRHQDRYRQRLENYFSEANFDETILARELAILADRADISEEITRLKSHLQQFSKDLGQTSPVGRKLDFLLQEINREINTMGSKSTDVKLSRLVIEMKTLAERIREQVQNIE
jgi:uncharacterized protein (TIGR00255 family)